MRRILAGFLCLLCLPSAAAGSADDPELRDSPGDQRTGLAPTSHLDILAAWFHDENETHVRASLQVKALDANSIGHYEFVWILAAKEPSEARAVGIGADLHPQGNQFYLLRSPRAGCAGTDPSAKGSALPGAVKSGSTLEWQIPLAAWDTQRGDLWSGFCAVTMVDGAPQPVRVADEARVTAADIQATSFQVGASRLVTFGPLHFDGTEPLLTDPEEAVFRQGAFDLTGLYYEFLEDHVNITFRMRSFALSDLSPCGFRAHGNFASGDWDDYLYFMLQIQARNATIRRVFFASPGQGPDRREQVASVLIQQGTPGYLRFSYPRNVWGNDTNVVEHSMSASLEHCKDGSDQIEYRDESFWSPGTAWLAALVSFAAATGWRRRRG